METNFDEYAEYINHYEDADDEFGTSNGTIVSPWTQSFNDLRKTMTEIDEFIWKKIVKIGDSEIPKENTRVKIHLNAFFESDKEPFESSYLRGKPIVFQLDKGMILPGIEDSVKTMTIGEESQFLISYQLLFGEMGCPPRIKQKADGLYIITLLEATDIGNDQALENVPKEDKNKFSLIKPKVDDLMNSARDKYKTGRTVDAIRSWTKAVEVLQLCHLKDMDEQNEQTALLQKLFTNLAVSYNKEDRPLKTLSSINDLRAIADVSRICKVLYQEGRAYVKIGRYDAAKTTLAKALKIQPLNKEIVAELSALEERIIKNNREEREMAQRAMNFKPKQNKEAKDLKVKPEVDKNFQLEMRKIIVNFNNDETSSKLKLIDNLSAGEIIFIDNLAKEFKLNKHHTVIGGVTSNYLVK